MYKKKEGYLFSVLALVFLFVTIVCRAEEATSPVPAHQKAGNFGMVYLTQWTYYLTNQKSEIEKHGSFKNWLQHPFELRFDKDHFNYNLILHTVVGQYYYLFYRSRGYTQTDAFLWTALSSFAFEFTIETVTEPPSVQDIHITPVMGTVLGIGVEKFSNYLHSLDIWYAHGLGYLLNPFTLLPPTSNLSASALILPNHALLVVKWGF